MYELCTQQLASGLAICCKLIWVYGGQKNCSGQTLNMFIFDSFNLLFNLWVNMFGK